MGEPLLVMALDVGDEVGPIPSAGLPGRRTEVATIAKRRLPKGAGGLAPKQKPTIGQGRLLGVVTEVLENHVGARVVVPDVIAVVKQDVDPALIIAVPRADIAERVGLGQALGQIDAVSVDMEFLNPEIQHTLPEFPGPRVSMVEIKAQSEGMDLILIVPGVGD